MLKFETDVRLNANAGPSDVMARLEKLVAPPNSFRMRERRKPLRGRIFGNDNFVRWPMNEYRIMSPRNLKFRVEPSGNTAVLIGSFVIWQPLRLIVLAWLGFGLTIWIHALIGGLFQHAEPAVIGKDLLMILAGCCMAFGYLWGTVFFGKKRDADLIRVLRIILASEAGAETVANLLTKEPRISTTFVDPE